MLLLARVGDQVDLFAWVPDEEAPPRRWTNTLCDELEVSSSADGGTVAYTDSNGHLWVLRAGPQDSGVPVGERITAAEQAHLILHPAVSADGTGLVAALRADRRRDDTDLVHIGLDPDRGVDLGPAWSNAADSGWSVLKALSGQFSPAWSPRGNQILHTILHSKWTGQVIAEAWLSGVQYSTTRQLTMNGGLIEQPDFSPDGRSFAFAVDSGGLGGWDVFEHALDSGAQRLLLGGAGRQSSPAYAPDGRTVVLLSTESDPGVLLSVDLENPDRVETVRPFGTTEVELIAVDW